MKEKKTFRKKDKDLRGSLDGLQVLKVGLETVRIRRRNIPGNDSRRRLSKLPARESAPVRSGVNNVIFSYSSMTLPEIKIEHVSLAILYRLV